MTRVEQLEQEIEKLNPEEFAQLRDWLLEQDWAEWDRQIERDAASGRLDRLKQRALADHAALTRQNAGILGCPIEERS